MKVYLKHILIIFFPFFFFFFSFNKKILQLKFIYLYIYTLTFTFLFFYNSSEFKRGFSTIIELKIALKKQPSLNSK